MPAHPESIEAAVAALAAADEKKAVAPVLLEVADVLGVIDLFAIVTGTSERHLKALADEVERAMKVDQERPVIRREGTADSGWIILDYGDVVFHLFLGEARDNFDLERLWSDVPRRDPATGALVDAGRLTPREQREDLLVEG